MGPLTPQKRVFTSESKSRKNVAERPIVPVASSGVSNAEVLKAIEALRSDLSNLVVTQGGDGETIAPPPAAPADPGVFDGHTEEEMHQLRASLAAMSRNIMETKAEIVALRPQDAEEDRLMIVSHELDAVVAATEGATETILNCAERIDDLAEDLKNHATEEDEKEKLDYISNEVVAVFEACNFQDLTGQRINKVVNTLKFVEERIMSMIEIWGDAEGFTGIKASEGDRLGVPTDQDSHLLNGPQHEDVAISQDDIDSLFD
ncbi:MAG: protein phosphatase CheZ [Rhodospirillales bacterium]|nr:protein phosphatase CheZ [Rhodospirillales bacterium]